MYHTLLNEDIEMPAIHERMPGTWHDHNDACLRSSRDAGNFPVAMGRI